MLVFTGIAPHPPLLIPSIGKENLRQVDKTVSALKKLEQDLYAAKPDSLIVISPHGQIFAESFSINLNTDFTGNFQTFGDFSTKLEFKGDIFLANQLKQTLLDKMPFILISDRLLDHGVLVPLYYLTPHLKNIKVVPIGYSMLGLEEHFEFGRLLCQTIQKMNKRIAVIASGDLSHCLTAEAPGGFSEKGKIFDEQLVKSIKNKDLKGVLHIEANLLEEAGECGLRSIIILLGMIAKMDYEPQILSYEGPFGVGYLVANFKIF